MRAGVTTLPRPLPYSLTYPAHCDRPTLTTAHPVTCVAHHAPAPRTPSPLIDQWSLTALSDKLHGFGDCRITTGGHKREVISLPKVDS